MITKSKMNRKVYGVQAYGGGRHLQRGESKQNILCQRFLELGLRGVPTSQKSQVVEPQGIFQTYKFMQ